MWQFFTSRTKMVSFLCLSLMAGCGIAPMDPTLISDTPAAARSFAVAQRAVRACSDVANRDRVIRNLRKAGFDVSSQRVELRGGRSVRRLFVSSPDDAVSVFMHGSSCYVGLENMTPSQSAQLAQIWVKDHNAKPNSAFGDGLSDHVSGAWRHFFSEPARFPDKARYFHRIYIAAYKTWPHGAYDPQNNVPFDIGDIFPDVPGAAVELTHAIECKPQVSTGPRSGAFLPCSGPSYRPR